MSFLFLRNKKKSVFIVIERDERASNLRIKDKLLDLFIVNHLFAFQM